MVQDCIGQSESHRLDPGALPRSPSIAAPAARRPATAALAEGQAETSHLPDGSRPGSSAVVDARLARNPPPTPARSAGTDRSRHHGRIQTTRQSADATSAARIGVGQAAADGLAPGSGSVPCARYVGQPMERCAATVLHKGKDKADVTVTWPDGGTRVISFHAGQPAASNGQSGSRFTREGSLNLIRIGASERFEITDTVAFGTNRGGKPSPYCPTALLPYCPTALLPYCPTALLPYCPTALLPYCPTALLPY